MKPTPTARHLLAFVLFAITALGCGYQAFYDDQITAEQVRIATSAVKDGDPGLFAHDPVYGPSGKWHMNSPVVTGALKLALIPAGYDDPALPFRMMTGVVAMLYLGGMYALLYRQTRSWSVSVYVAIMSAAVMETLPGLTWGFGSLEATDPASLCLAAMPLLLIAYLHYERRWLLVGVFACVGMLANVHLATAVNMATVLVVVYVVGGRFRWRAIGMAVLCVLATALTALPHAGYLLALRASMSTGASSAYRAARDALNLSNMQIFYSEMPKSLLEWRLMAALAALGIIGALVLMRVERYRVRDRQVWVWLLAASLLTGFGLHGCSQLAGKWTHTAPPVLGFVQALRLAMLPLFVLLAQGLTNVLRLVRYRHVVQWLCVIAVLVWLVPSPNLRVGRRAALAVATGFMAAEETPANLRRQRDRADQRDELASIARWARENTSTHAVFLTDDAAFRMMSRRSIFAAGDDLPYFYALAPQKLAQWLADMRLQAAIFNPPAGRGSPQAVVDFVNYAAAMDRYAGVTEWYILFSKDVTFESLGPLRRAGPAGRSRWHQLYRVDRPDDQQPPPANAGPVRLKPRLPLGR